MKKYEEKQLAYIATGEVRYFVDTSNAPVIEFDRSFVRTDGSLLKGRIWASMYRLEENTLLRKDKEFKSWYDQIARWLRHNFKRVEGVDGYFGPMALEWYQNGGKLAG